MMPGWWIFVGADLALMAYVLFTFHYLPAKRAKARDRELERLRSQ